MYKLQRLLILVGICALAVSGVEAKAKSKNREQSPELAAGQLPDCVDGDGRAISGNNNDEVIRWKKETKNEYLDRALVRGTLVKVLVDRESHLHLEITMGEERGNLDNHIEIVYNKSFGAVAGTPAGAEVIACGDYITSIAQSGPYKASPMGAIVHWVHKSTSNRHSSGFVSIDGKVYGLLDEKGNRGGRNFQADTSGDSDAN